MVTVRRFEEDDIEGISELWEEFAKMREDMTHNQILNENAPDYFFGYATGLLQRKDTLCLVAEDEGELAGYLIATKQRKPPIYSHTRIAYLSDVFVPDAHRKKGILTQFITELKAWCKNERITAIDVMLFKENELAQEIYRRMGFRDYRVVLRQEVGDPSA
ncbi:MAG: GNAT family N-acetyltransferase [Thermoplasmatota archaeon]